MIRDYIDQIDLEGKFNTETDKTEFSVIKENKNYEITPRSHG